jgi:glycerophosphoryl diester phosphodiesterase
MKRYLFLILTLLAVLPVMAKVPKVVAHRGYWRAPGAAQNSIRSLVKCDSIGVDACEFDVWISADGELYVNHNADVDGVIIETADSKTLDNCRLGNGEAVPRLEDFLNVAKGLKIDLVLEVKPHKDRAREDVAVPMIVKMINDKGLADRTSYITFSRNAFDRLVEQAEGPVLYLNGVSPKVLKEIGGDGADYHINIFRTNPGWIDELHAQNMPVNIWTVDSASDIQWCIDHGADFITTNEPELAMELVRKAYGSHSLTVMTYNLRFGERASMDKIAEVIKAESPDFVALQEVDVNSYRDAAGANKGLNYINELAEKTGMNGYFGKALNFPRGGYYGVGILSKHPSRSVERFELPNPKAVEPRVLLAGVFEIDGHMPVVFGSSHLDYSDKDTSEKQARYVLNILNGFGLPYIVGGDFNATNESGAVQAFVEVAKPLTADEYTFPSDIPKKKIDYIFGYPVDAFDLESTKVGKASPDAESDHLPVVSKIVLNYGYKEK